MKLIRHYFLFLSVLYSLFNPVQAETTVNIFHADSYTELLKQQKNQPFILIIWSVDCSSCLKEMALLKKIHQNNPELRMMMLATDSPAEIEQIQNYQRQFQLNDIEQWVFADENEQKLRFSIDPGWYGELPRTYFFDNRHQRSGHSGVLTPEKYQAQIDQLLHSH